MLKVHIVYVANRYDLSDKIICWNILEKLEDNFLNVQFLFRSRYNEPTYLST